MEHTFPYFPDKYKFESLVNPKNFLEYIGKKNPFEKIGIPKLCLFTGNKQYFNIIKKKYPMRKIRITSSETYWFRVGKHIVLLVKNCGIGGPSFVHNSEEFIAFGIKNFIILGNTGGIKKDIKPGDILVCQKAFRDEGLSHHYLKPSEYVSASKKIIKLLEDELTKNKINFIKGKTWTTDTMYRETKEEIEIFQKKGITNVEMETASLFALTKYRKVNAGAIYVVSDIYVVNNTLTGTKWDPQWKNKAMNDSINKTTNTVLKIISQLPD